MFSIFEATVLPHTCKNCFLLSGAYVFNMSPGLVSENGNDSLISAPPKPPSNGKAGPALTVVDTSSSANAKNGALGETVSGKKLKIREYPKFQSLEEERLYRKQHLAAAFRIFADRGFDEGVAGHISVRDPILTDHFCKLPYYRMSKSI